VPYYTKYHVSEQSAPVLLAPIRESLRELEQRARNYVERVNLQPGADKTLSAAHEAIARARQEIERLTETGSSTGAGSSSKGDSEGGSNG
jgi:hypothetical protein